MDLYEEICNNVSNCKLKCYPDGTTVASFCSFPVFHAFPSSAFASPSDSPCLSDFDPIILQSDEVSAPTASEDKKSASDDPRADSVKRSKDKIFDLIACNEWSYFFTGTLGNDCDFDTTSASDVLKPIQKWLNNMVTRYGFRYILVAELQPKSKRIHFHGLLNDALKVVDSGTRLVKGYDKPLKIDTIIAKGLSLEDCRTVYNLPQWKYGYSTAIKVYGSTYNIANYITKYITKDSKMIFGRFYWSSKNLQRQPFEIHCNVDFDRLALPEYSNSVLCYKFKYYTIFPGQSFDFPMSNGEIETFSPSPRVPKLEDFEEIEVISC